LAKFTLITVIYNPRFKMAPIPSSLTSNEITINVSLHQEQTPTDFWLIVGYTSVSFSFSPPAKHLVWILTKAQIIIIIAAVIFINIYCARKTTALNRMEFMEEGRSSSIEDRGRDRRRKHSNDGWEDVELFGGRTGSDCGTL
jgi:hypothetical protein